MEEHSSDPSCISFEGPSPAQVSPPNPVVPVGDVEGPQGATAWESCWISSGCPKGPARSRWRSRPTGDSAVTSTGLPSPTRLQLRQSFPLFWMRFSGISSQEAGICSVGSSALAVRHRTCCPLAFPRDRFPGTAQQCSYACKALLGEEIFLLSRGAPAARDQLIPREGEPGAEGSPSTGVPHPQDPTGSGLSIPRCAQGSIHRIQGSSTGSKVHPQVQKGMEPGRSELQQRPEVAPEEARPLQSSERKEVSEPVLKSIPDFKVWGSVQRRQSRVSQP